MKGWTSFWILLAAPYFNRNLGLLKKDGRLVIIGFMGGRIAHEVDIQTLMLKRATVTGSTMRGRTAAEKQQIAEALRRHVWPLLEAGKCKPLIYASYPMAEIAEAHACLDSGQHLGKVVITMTSWGRIPAGCRRDGVREVKSRPGPAWHLQPSRNRRYSRRARSWSASLRRRTARKRGGYPA